VTLNGNGYGSPRLKASALSGSRGLDLLDHKERKAQRRSAASVAQRLPMAALMSVLAAAGARVLHHCRQILLLLHLLHL
jgi:hypothetical protein